MLLVSQKEITQFKLKQIIKQRDMQTVALFLKELL